MAGLCVRSVLVTGANWGISLELVRQLLGKAKPPEGIFAGSWDPVGKRVQELKTLASRPANLVILPLDVTHPASIQAAAARVQEQLKGSGLTLQINNAGTVTLSTLESETPEGMALVYATNVTGPCWGAWSQGCAAAGRPSSTCPARAAPAPWYSKAALNTLTQCQALAHSGDGVLSVALQPGWVQTDVGNGGPSCWDGPRGAPLAVDTSIRGILDVLPTLSEKDNGAFVSWEGKVLPW